MAKSQEDRSRETSQHKFPIGTKVKLNVGGPIMSVKSYDYRGQITCQWFSGKKLEEGEFAPDTLAVAPDDSEEKS